LRWEQPPFTFLALSLLQAFFSLSFHPFLLLDIAHIGKFFVMFACFWCSHNLLFSSLYLFFLANCSLEYADILSGKPVIGFPFISGARSLGATLGKPLGGVFVVIVPNSHLWFAILLFTSSIFTFRLLASFLASKASVL